MQAHSIGRYKFICEQLQLEERNFFPSEYKLAFSRIIGYICNYTMIRDITDINERILYNYIKYQIRMKKKPIDQAVRDVKYFVKYVKSENLIESQSLTNVDLSTQNFYLWTKM